MSTILRYEFVPLPFLLEECRLAIDDTNSVGLKGDLHLWQEDGYEIMFTGNLTVSPGNAPMPTFTFVGEMTGDYVYRSMTINPDALYAAIKYQFLQNRIARIDLKFNYS